MSEEVAPLLMENLPHAVAQNPDWVLGKLCAVGMSMKRGGYAINSHLFREQRGLRAESVENG